MIDGHFAPYRTVGGHAETSTGQVHTPRSKQQPYPTACKSNEKTFNKRLADQAETARAQSRSHGEFRLALCPARKLEARNVHASNEQDNEGHSPLQPHANPKLICNVMLDRHC